MGVHVPVTGVGASTGLMLFSPPGPPVDKRNGKQGHQTTKQKQ